MKGQATDAEIAAWKASHPGGIFYVQNETHIAYFREPMRQDVAKAHATANEPGNEDNPFAAIEKFGDLVFIGGSRELLTDDHMFLGAKKELAKHWNGIEATSGNL